MEFEITDFQRDVIAKSREIPVLVDFWAEWCGPCHILGPVLERLASRNIGKWVLAKVNTEKHQDIAARYKIGSIPDVKLFVDGIVVNEFTGALPENLVIEWLKKAIPGKFFGQIQESLDLLKSGQVKNASVILEHVVEVEPDNVEAKVLLGRSIVFTDPDRAEVLCMGIEADNPYYETAELVIQYAGLFRKRNNPDLLAASPVKALYLDAIESLSRQDYDSALDKLIRVLGENRTYDNDGARKACIAVFHFLGEEHEITKKHRRSFGSALNV
jgi:putative thioredoxin